VYPTFNLSQKELLGNVNLFKSGSSYYYGHSVLHMPKVKAIVLILLVSLSTSRPTKSTIQNQEIKTHDFLNYIFPSSACEYEE
jgi:hypothetical protein